MSCIEYSLCAHRGFYSLSQKRRNLEPQNSFHFLLLSSGLDICKLQIVWAFCTTSQSNYGRVGVLRFAKEINHQ